MNYLPYFSSALCAILAFSCGQSAADETQVAVPARAIGVSADPALLIQEVQTTPDLELLNITQTQLVLFKLGRARDAWVELLRQHVPELSPSAEAQALTPGVLRKMRTAILSILSRD